jgi:hypothetical protein
MSVRVQLAEPYCRAGYFSGCSYLPCCAYAGFLLQPCLQVPYTAATGDIQGSTKL